MMKRGQGGVDPVFDEPHFRPPKPACPSCGYSLAGLATDARSCPECGDRFRDDVGNPSTGSDADVSPWDEPAIRAAGIAPPPGARTWARRYEQKHADTGVGASWTWTLLVAAAAGPWAVLGALMNADVMMPGLLVPLVLAPVVEELMKVAAATLVIEKAPWLFRSRTQVLLCCGMGGLVFAAIENIFYLHLSFGPADPALAAWRWSVCVALHVACSLIAGLGIARVWKDVATHRRPAELADAFGYLVIAMVVHGAYNALATVLSVAGVL